MRGAGRLLLRAVAVASAAGYCGWWGYWLSHGRLAPSPMLVVTGLPCPTTGLTRSLLSLMNGQWLASLCWHPLAVPIVALLAASLLWLARQLALRRRLVLPRAFGWLWAAVLLAGWAAKLLIGPAWW
ncbi:MAG TPA: DUF2752 domain-containing protein [Phycisphaerae bacterium]|nr:DUF2752 domain-containing protein [Phycisphaerae bacterium]